MVQFSSRRQKQNEPPVRRTKAQSQMAAVLFKRSRTLTGSVSSAVSSATEKAAALRSPRLKEHDLRYHRRKLAFLLMISAMIAGLIVWLLHQFILDVRIAGDTSGSRAYYVKQVEQYLAANPLQRLHFMLDDRALTQAIQKDSPEIENIVVRDSGFLLDEAEFTLRQATARWKLGEKVYYVDKNGVAFEKKPAKEPSLEIRDESGLPVSSQRIVSNQMLRFIGQVVGELSTHSGEVEQVIIPQGGLKEVDVVLKGKGYPVKLHTDRDPVEQAIDAASAIRHIDAKRITPQYLDVRVEGKAFYKET